MGFGDLVEEVVLALFKKGMYVGNSFSLEGIVRVPPGIPPEYRWAVVSPSGEALVLAPDPFSAAFHFVLLEQGKSFPSRKTQLVKSDTEIAKAEERVRWEEIEIQEDMKEEEAFYSEPEPDWDETDDEPCGDSQADTGNRAPAPRAGVSGSGGR